MLRTICKSRAYQLSSESNEHNGQDKQNFSRYYPRRLTAEVLADAAVPPWRRVDYPLLYCGALLVAVPGIAVAATAHCDTGGWQLSWEAADTILRVS